MRGYCVQGQIGKRSFSLLVDTGAAVSLAQKELWDQLDQTTKNSLKPWTASQLVGADGTLLQVFGAAEVTLKLGSRDIPCDFVVVSPLTNDAILGADFLTKHCAQIDHGRKQLKLNRPLSLTLGLGVQTKSISDRGMVSLVSMVEFPARSEQVVMAKISVPDLKDKEYLIEGCIEAKLSCVVARCLVCPRQGDSRVPVRLLNPSEHSVKIPAGTVIASWESIEPKPQPKVATVAQAAEIDQIKSETLLTLAKEASSDLTPEQHKHFCSLLMGFADIFAVSSSDTGRTDKLEHTIHTGNSPPVRQAVRRLPPPRRAVVQELLTDM